MLFGAWLLHSVRLAAALGMAIVAMQAPAVTREYKAALLQLVRSSAEDIAQRKISAQRFYGIPIENEVRWDPPTSQNLFFGERGSQTFPSQSRFDFALNYDIPIFKLLEPWLKVTDS